MEDDLLSLTHCLTAINSELHRKIDIFSQMKLRCGSVAVQGSVAYVQQQAWIMNTTLQDNIVFGAEFNEDKCV